MEFCGSESLKFLKFGVLKDNEEGDEKGQKNTDSTR